MLGRIKSRKNRSSAPSVLQNMTLAVTLTDRLKRAGIRECEPDWGTKTGNLSQNRKNQPKKGLAEKHKERNKKLQNFCNDSYSSYFKDCYENKTTRGKTLSKNCATFSKTLRRKIKGSAKKTLFASLDFIKDCQKYKKKIRNSEKDSELKRERKSESVFSNRKRNLNVKAEPQKLHISKTYSKIPFCDGLKKKEALILDVCEGKEIGNFCERKNPLLSDQNTGKVNTEEESINDERKKQSNKKLSETLSHVNPFFHEFPPGDVARIDKKYLQSLLSIINAKSKNECENNEETACEKNGQRKRKKKSNEVLPENKTKMKNPEGRKDAAEEIQKENIQTPLYNNLILSKISREATKSEAQICVKKNNFYNQSNSEMMSEKNMAHKKPEVNVTRKNRKNRNKLIKTKNDLVFPNEIPNAVDIKELWRRDIREKSENSLSSNSSSTVPKNDADPEQKNLELESYKVLKKFVEEEVKKMSNESEKKNNFKEVENLKYNFKTNEFKSVNMKESEQVENIFKKLNISMAENLNDEIDIIKSEISSREKKLTQIEHSKRYSIYEGEKINFRSLQKLAEDKLKNQKGNKKLLKEKGKTREKTATQIINNWSILNRLEQAFLALGTPNFQNKNIRNSKALKDEELSNKEKTKVDTSSKDQNHLSKISKKLQKSKESEKKKGSKDGSNTLPSTPKTATQSLRNKRPESGRQQNLIQDKQQKNKLKKAPKSEGSKNNTLVNIPENKQIGTIQERKKFSDPTAHENFKKKPTDRSHTKTKVTVPEPKQLRKKQDQKPPLRTNKIAQAKKNEPCQEKSPKALAENKNSKDDLKRKKTFDIISYALSTRARKPENYNQTDSVDSVKNRFSQIKNQQSKKNDSFQENFSDKTQSSEKQMKKENGSFLENVIDKPQSSENHTKKENVSEKSQSSEKHMKNEARTITKSFIPKKLVKIPIKIKSEYQDKCQIAEVKEYFKVPEKCSVKIPEVKTDQEKKPCEKEIKEIPIQIQEKKVLNIPSERVIKERSILSMSGKQQTSPESAKELMQIEEKDTSDIYHCPCVTNAENSKIKKSQNDLYVYLKPSTKFSQEINKLVISNSTFSTSKLVDFNSTENPKEIDIDNNQENSLVKLSKKLTPFSGISNNKSVSQQVSETEPDEIELNFSKCQRKMLWEQDIGHYRAIVKEIMSHYNRINGFLTHSEHLQSFPSESSGLLSNSNSTDKDSDSDKPLKMNLREYRRKIMSEYQALPIFEYKKLFQEKKQENLLTIEATKGNLTVIKDVSTEMDLDVKDFQPKIKKVLDSQLYVDVENLNKRKHLKVKFIEKKSSLQEIVLDKNEKMVSRERLRSSSTVKTIPLLPSSSVFAGSSHKLNVIESFRADLTDTVTSTSLLEETESEYL